MADEYSTISDMAADEQWLERLRACAGQQRAADDPYFWVAQYRYQLSSAPGFAAAYKYAVDTGVPNPGRDQAVISDAMILSAVQALRDELGQLPEGA